MVTAETLVRFHLVDGYGPAVLQVYEDGWRDAEAADFYAVEGSPTPLWNVGAPQPGPGEPHVPYLGAPSLGDIAAFYKVSKPDWLYPAVKHGDRTVYVHQRRHAERVARHNKAGALAIGEQEDGGAGSQHLQVSQADLDATVRRPPARSLLIDSEAIIDGDRIASVIEQRSNTVENADDAPHGPIVQHRPFSHKEQTDGPGPGQVSVPDIVTHKSAEAR